MPRGVTQRVLDRKKRHEVKVELETEIKVKGKEIFELTKQKLMDAFASDPMMYAAVIGATVLIKQGVDWVELALTDDSTFRTLLPFWAYLMDILAPEVREKTLENLRQELSGTKAEITEWLFSFVAAYVIVNNFGLIMQSTGNAVTGLVSMAKGLLMGGAAVV